MKRRLWFLLCVPFIALLPPQIYNRPAPALFGLPFFYWYQLAWVVLTSILLGIVALFTREPDHR